MNVEVFLSERGQNCTRVKYYHAVANSKVVYKLNVFFRATIDNCFLFYVFQALYRYMTVPTGQIFFQTSSAVILLSRVWYLNQGHEKMPSCSTGTGFIASH